MGVKTGKWKNNEERYEEASLKYLPLKDAS